MPKDDMNGQQEDSCIFMTDENGEKIRFYILEETRLGGRDYILVTDAAEDEDGECYVLKNVSENKDEDEAIYEFVENEDELDYMFKIFTELMEDSETTLTK